MHLIYDWETQTVSVSLDFEVKHIPRHENWPTLVSFVENILRETVKSHLGIDIDITLPRATKAITRAGLGTAETP